MLTSYIHPVFNTNLIILHLLYIICGKNDDCCDIEFCYRHLD